MEAPAPTIAETAVAVVGVSASVEATMAEVRAPETAKAVIAEARAPEVTKAIVMAARLSMQEAGMQAIVQGPLLLRESARETKVEAAAAQTQLAPLAAWVKELEEELTHAVSDRDAFRSRAEEATASGKALAEQLGAEESAHRLTTDALNEALAIVEASQIEAMVLRGTVEELGSEASRAAEASWVEAQRLKEKAEACQAKTQRWEQKDKESEAEFTRAAEASGTVQTVLDTEIEEHEALKHAALSACEALEVEGRRSALRAPRRTPLPLSPALTNSFTPASRDFVEVLEDGDHLKPSDLELVDAVNTLKLQDPEVQVEVTADAPAADPKNGAGAASTLASKPKNENGAAHTSKSKNTITKEKKRTGVTAAVEKTKQKDGRPPLSLASSREGAAAPSGRRSSYAATSSGGGGAATNTRPPSTSRKLLQPLM
ncbi:uncharacterized protein [Miscanthus floridulus]|uniref:uncharacterized protein n=1 Tax=Miscanthus floridulus TaxID=154761 RepID=UPI003458C546